MKKALVILGQTATGKSDLAVELALKFGGEIISADSRQVYRGLDIGAGKISHEEMRGIPHHLLDIIEPSELYSVTKWRAAAQKAMNEIWSRGRLPIIIGGTGYYTRALVDDMKFPSIETDINEQNELESLPAEKLLEELRTLDPSRAAAMSTPSESRNKRRLARAVMLARAGSSTSSSSNAKPQAKDHIDFLQIGLTVPDAELKERIRSRLIKRLESGMIEEVKDLHEQKGVSWQRLDDLGLEYRYVAKHLQGELTYDELVTILATKIWQYAKRQKTWFRRDNRINWFATSDREGILKEVEGWI